MMQYCSVYSSSIAMSRFCLARGCCIVIRIEPAIVVGEGRLDDPEFEMS
jgi:hypothetical protein